jgi:hypothetical protein
MSETDYGTTRERGPTVPYSEIERAAIAILKSGRRPTIEMIRQALGRGSPNHILESMQRFWRDLGARIEGDPAALSRLPAEIVETVEAIWQRALAMASQAAKHDDNAARARLEELHLETELRSQSFELRQKEYEAAAREREQALTDSRSQVATLLSELSSNRATKRAQVARLRELGTQVNDYRAQLATLIERAVNRNQVAVDRKPRPAKRSRIPINIKKAKRRAAAKNAARRPKSKRGHKR